MTQLFKPAAILAQEKTVVLYGKGNIGQKVLKIVLDQGWDVFCILDRKALPGEQINHIPVYHPDANEVSAIEHKIPVIISIFNRDVNIYALAQELHDQGFINLVSFWDFHTLYPDQLGDHFWLTDRNYILTHQDEISDTSALWADELSRQLYNDMIQARLDGNMDLVDKHLEPLAIQYLPSDIPNWLPGTRLRFIDCGAFDGDTISSLVEYSIPLEYIAAFEPDFENFAKLTLQANRLSHDLNIPIMLWPSAIGIKTETIWFSSGSGEGSKKAAIIGVGEPILSVALDSVLLGSHPNFIKMDIEGSELDAIIGARQIILEDNPRIAVCVYHKSDHIWRIPLTLTSISNKYKLYLRNYAFNGFETVMYAVPRKESEKHI